LADPFAAVKPLNDLVREEPDNPLLSRLIALEHQNREIGQRLSEAEERIGELSRLHVASQRLHGSFDRAEVLLGIAEIVADLLGSEEFALYEHQPDGQLATAMVQGALQPGHSPGRRARQVLGTGKTYLAGRDGADEDSNLAACIPLILGGHVTGVIAVFRLLPHRVGLASADEELCDVLGLHAAVALHFARERTAA
jgi:hypothetical protein